MTQETPSGTWTIGSLQDGGTGRLTLNQPARRLNEGEKFLIEIQTKEENGTFIREVKVIFQTPEVAEDFLRLMKEYEKGWKILGRVVYVDHSILSSDALTRSALFVLRIPVGYANLHLPSERALKEQLMHTPMINRKGRYLVIHNIHATYEDGFLSEQRLQNLMLSGRVIDVVEVGEPQLQIDMVSRYLEHTEGITVLLLGVGENRREPRLQQLLKRYNTRVEGLQRYTEVIFRVRNLY